MHEIRFFDFRFMIHNLEHEFKIFVATANKDNIMEECVRSLLLENMICWDSLKECDWCPREDFDYYVNLDSGIVYNSAEELKAELLIEGMAGI